MPAFTVTLNDKDLICTSDVVHLGIKMTFNLQSGTEIRARKHDFIGKTNHVLSKYKCMHAHVKCKLIDSYCCSFYGAELWDLTSCCFLALLRSWNIAIRHAWSLPFNAHTRFLSGLAGFNLADRIFKRFYNFCTKIECIDNVSVRYIFKLASHNKSSFINRNIAFIQNFNHDNLILDNDLHYIHSIIELHNIMNHMLYLDNRFNQDELGDLYTYFSTV
jgi:hypothetical protein